MTQTKVVWITHDIDRFVEFEWVIEAMDRSEYHLEVILIDTERRYFYDYLEQNNIPVHQIALEGKLNWPRISFKIQRLLRKIRPDVVHTHFLVADLTGLPAAFLAGVPKRIQTRHSGNYFRKIHRTARIYDGICNRFSTDIVAVSQHMKESLISEEGQIPDKIHLIPHGLKLSAFKDVSEERVSLLKEKYNPEGRSPVVGVISRYMELKDIPSIISAFERLLQSYPDALLILANTVGADKDKVQNMLRTRLPAESYVEVLFETDNAAFYKLFDICTHVPTAAHVESFGLVYLEALLAGVPGVFTLSGIAPEFIGHEKNAMVVPYRSPEGIYDAFVRILKDEGLRQKVIENGRRDVAELFSIDDLAPKWWSLYGNRP